MDSLSTFSTEMFFLVRGVISVEKMVLAEDNSGKEEHENEWRNQNIAQLQAGSYFGELALLLKPKSLKGQRRAASCIAVTDCDCRLLRKSTFNQVCDDFPELRLYLQAEADRKYAMYSSKTPEEIAADQKAKKIQTMKDALSEPPEATLSTLQSTLNAINLRMSRLEVNMGRLQAKGGAAADHLDIKPPAQVVTGSNGRKYITSPPLKAAAPGGWKSVRKVVVPETAALSISTTTRDEEDTRSNKSITPKSMLSNSRWASPTHVTSPTHTEESLRAIEKAIEEAHKTATAAQERQKESETDQYSKMLSNRRW